MAAEREIKRVPERSGQARTQLCEMQAVGQTPALAYCFLRSEYRVTPNRTSKEVSLSNFLSYKRQIIRAIFQCYRHLRTPSLNNWYDCNTECIRHSHAA